MAKITRENAILSYPTIGDLSAKVGQPVSMTYSNGSAKVNSWEPNGGYAFGVIIEADSTRASVAIFNGGFSGTLKVKLVEQTLPGNLLYLAQNNGVVGFADRGEESFSGETVICAQALESGVEGEQIEAVIFRPEPFIVA